ncbi:MAG: hypothetical protein A3I11_02250 [Elusimicrobia bacterium RIFCSPLOWO2_02_FULL_39_32]|nr:MAG: hypothetical protein A3B80_07135 [Elusimicrobia bacterium RIFCSPHIGHO2_02_FULL_39_36]OGR92200.1 MAG: hypothetical protein A3I11_02250 [Elusimicrobia bacterium RIFCSPLOWO2_02_FULL_39_32]OGR99933.1 MAG: hypothetical protein A3G85_03190 [Elusimicrobia bacterium RIFCSPLOWO2_12_FULL_39_28]
MNILLAYHSRWHIQGYFFENYLNEKHRIFYTPIDNSAYYGDWKGRLPFYLPKKIPTTIASLEKKFSNQFNFIIELDGVGQHHLSGMRSSMAVKALWSCDIFRKDKKKFHKWIEKDFDIIFVAHKNYLNFFEPKKTEWLPYACNTSTFKKLDLPKIYDVAYIGNLNKDLYSGRIKILNEISKKFKVYISDNVYGEEISKIYSQSKIIFNYSQFSEINMRIFEALSCGSLLVTNRLGKETGLEDLFQDQTHLIFYDDINDLKEKLDYYLSNESERESIALGGYKEALSKHTFQDRFIQILNYIKKCN